MEINETTVGFNHTESDKKKKGTLIRSELWIMSFKKSHFFPSGLKKNNMILCQYKMQDLL